MTVLAYALVLLPISTLVVTFLVVTLGVALGIFVFRLPLFWIADKHRGMAIGFRGLVTGFLCGVLAEAAGFAYGYLVFHWLVGPDSFTVLPICVAAIPLLLAPIHNLRKARRVEAAFTGVSEHAVAIILVESTWGAAIGEAVGFVGGIATFVAISMS